MKASYSFSKAGLDMPSGSLCSPVEATFPPDVRRQDLFLKQEREARKVGRGLWAQLFVNEPALTSPSPVNTPALLPTHRTHCREGYLYQILRNDVQTFTQEVKGGKISSYSRETIKKPHPREL